MSASPVCCWITQSSTALKMHLCNIGKWMTYSWDIGRQGVAYYGANKQIQLCSHLLLSVTIQLPNQTKDRCPTSETGGTYLWKQISQRKWAKIPISRPSSDGLHYVDAKSNPVVNYVRPLNTGNGSYSLRLAPSAMSLITQLATWVGAGIWNRK